MTIYTFLKISLKQFLFYSSHIITCIYNYIFINMQSQLANQININVDRLKIFMTC